MNTLKNRYSLSFVPNISQKLIFIILTKKELDRDIMAFQSSSYKK